MVWNYRVIAKPKETICDPACGTGGFLLAAHDYITNHFPTMIKETLSGGEPVA